MQRGICPGTGVGMSPKDVVGEREWELSSSSPSVVAQGDKGVREDIVTQGSVETTPYF